MNRSFPSPFRLRSRRKSNERRGALLVLIAMLLAAFFVTVIFSVDVAYMHLINAQLRTATDASAKAAVEVLARTEDVASAREAAKNLAALNLVGGKPLTLEDADIDFGSSDTTRLDGKIGFVSGGSPLSAARVTGRKLDSSASGGVPLFFGGLLGRPRFETELSATASRRDRDICLVVDRSGSMAGRKIADLKDSITIFLEALDETVQDEFVGLASYSTSPSRDHDLTDDLAAIDSTMRRLNASGLTNIGGGIDVGRAILNDGRGSSFVEKTMIVLTDGIHNTGTDPLAAARRAQANGIVIHTITFGADAEQGRMRQIADLTGGQFHHAPNGTELKRIYREIALTLQTQLTD